MPTPANRPWAAEFYHADDRNSLAPRERRADARARHRRKIVAELTRRDPKRLAAVIRALKHCRPGDRCGSGACPECRTAAKRWLRRIIKREFGGVGSLVTCTIIPTDPAMMPETFKDAARVDWRGYLEELLADAGMAGMPVIACLDVSQNRFLDARRKVVNAYACLHVHLYTRDRDPQTLTKALTAAPPRHPLVWRRVLSRWVTVTPTKARSYCLKDGYREIDHQPAKSRSGGRKLKRVRDRPIGPKHPLFGELMLFLHEAGISQRIFSRNLQHHDDQLRRQRARRRMATPE